MSATIKVSEVVRWGDTAIGASLPALVTWTLIVLPWLGFMIDSDYLIMTVMLIITFILQVSMLIMMINVIKIFVLSIKKERSPLPVPSRRSSIARTASGTLALKPGTAVRKASNAGNIGTTTSAAAPRRASNAANIGPTTSAAAPRKASNAGNIGPTTSSAAPRKDAGTNAQKSVAFDNIQKPTGTTPRKGSTAGTNVPRTGSAYNIQGTASGIQRTATGGIQRTTTANLKRLGYVAPDAWRHVICISVRRGNESLVAKTLESLNSQKGVVVKAQIHVAVVFEQQSHQSDTLRTESDDRFGTLTHLRRTPTIGSAGARASSEIVAFSYFGNQWCTANSISMDKLMATTCDAGTVFHPRYFGSVSVAASAQTKANCKTAVYRMYQPPVVYDLFQIAFYIRSMCWLRTWIELGLWGPNQVQPVNVYSVHLPLLAKADWADPSYSNPDAHGFLLALLTAKAPFLLEEIPCPAICSFADVHDDTKYWAATKKTFGHFWRLGKKGPEELPFLSGMHPIRTGCATIPWFNQFFNTLIVDAFMAQLGIFLIIDSTVIPVIKADLTVPAINVNFGTLFNILTVFSIIGIVVLFATSMIYEHKNTQWKSKRKPSYTIVYLIECILIPIVIVVFLSTPPLLAHTGSLLRIVRRKSPQPAPLLSSSDPVTIRGGTGGSVPLVTTI